MKFVNPEVFMIASTQINDLELQSFLNRLGVPGWNTNAASDAEKLMEVAGKTCYMSFHPDLNRNLTRVRHKQNKEYIQDGLIKVGHESVLEHASVTFAIHGVSRIFTHELVRHRAGCAYSQQSGRYVRVDEIEAYRPECLTDEENVLLADSLKAIEILYNNLESKVFERVGDDFNTKKQVTSAIRRILPNGQVNTIIFTANHRALRHILKMRLSIHAEEEIRYVFKLILTQLQINFPSIYEDIEAE
jgi:thymidylate synthase (FAD)